MAVHMNTTSLSFITSSSEYIDTIFTFYGYIDFFKQNFYYLVRCLSMIVWTHAVWGHIFVYVVV